jgi:hypothetical protein
MRALLVALLLGCAAPALAQTPPPDLPIARSQQQAPPAAPQAQPSQPQPPQAVQPAPRAAFDLNSVQPQPGPIDLNSIRSSPQPAQRQTVQARQLVFHVAAARGAAPSVSLGIVQGAMLRQRRLMQLNCTWAPAADLRVETSSVVPLQNPDSLGGAERFGVHYADLFSSLSASQGAVTTPEQRACVQRTMTRVGQSLMRRRADATAPQP